MEDIEKTLIYCETICYDDEIEMELQHMRFLIAIDAFTKNDWKDLKNIEKKLMKQLRE
jgi:hypothetical protein